MAFIPPQDRVAETTSTTGSGTFTLTGALTGGYRTFAAGGPMANGDTTLYAARNTANNQWEVGIGTWGTGGTLARTTILASSNAGAVVTFTAAPDTVFMDFPSTLILSAGTVSSITGTNPSAVLAGMVQRYCTDLTGGAGFVVWNGSVWQRLAPYTVRELLTTAATLTANTTLTTADGSRSISDSKAGVLWDGAVALKSFQIGTIFPVGWSNVSSRARLTWKPTGYTGDAADLLVSTAYLVEYPTLDVF